MPPTPRASALRPQTLAGLGLDELLEVSGGVLTTGRRQGDPALVTGITVDSRMVAPGDLYVALPGRLHHGAAFAQQAVRAGALAVLTDEAGGGRVSGLGKPVLVVADPRRVMATVAARIYSNPSVAMTMLAVTGTNGKTTTSYLLDAALRSAGRRTGVVGTLGFMLDGVPLEATRTTVTTPESPELQGLLAVLVEGGVDTCVMEVSSHALVLGRVEAIRFDVSAFINLGQDHLDFHGDERSYFEAKALLFTPERTRHAVVNVDDPHGQQIAERVRAADGMALSTVSLASPSTDYAAEQVLPQPDGRTQLMIRTPRRTVEVSLGLPGEFNVRNAITALAMLDVIRVDLDQAAAGLTTARVPGRMERVELGAGAPKVFVDFAHTPEAVTAALRAVTGSRRVVVLGCGGDRDPEKRGPIGAAAVLDADVVVVTDDNPRTEEPAVIRGQILAGARAAAAAARTRTRILEEADRRLAIRRGLELTGPDGVLSVLGKGHETGQQVGSVLLPFSDLAVVREEWAELVSSAGVAPPGTADGPA